MPCSVNVALQYDSNRSARLFDGARVQSEGESDARSTGALAGSCQVLLRNMAPKRPWSLFLCAANILALHF